MTHHVKVLPKYFRALLLGDKNFELRKNDRNYKVGDVLVLKEWVQNDYEDLSPMIGLTSFIADYSGYTGAKMERVVSYVLEGPLFGLKKGWVIMGLK